MVRSRLAILGICAALMVLGVAVYSYASKHYMVGSVVADNITSSTPTALPQEEIAIYPGATDIREGVKVPPSVRLIDW